MKPKNDKLEDAENACKKANKQLSSALRKYGSISPQFCRAKDVYIEAKDFLNTLRGSTK